MNLYISENHDICNKIHVTREKMESMILVSRVSEAEIGSEVISHKKMRELPGFYFHHRLYVLRKRAGPE